MDTSACFLPQQGRLNLCYLLFHVDFSGFGAPQGRANHRLVCRLGQL